MAWLGCVRSESTEPEWPGAAEAGAWSRQTRKICNFSCFAWASGITTWPWIGTAAQLKLRKICNLTTGQNLVEPETDTDYLGSEPQLQFLSMLSVSVVEIMSARVPSGKYLTTGRGKWRHTQITLDRNRSSPKASKNLHFFSLCLSQRDSRTHAPH